MSSLCDPGLLLEYATGRLDPARVASVSSHIRQCSACADAVAGYSSVADSLDRCQVPPVSVDFNRRLWSRIDAAQSAPWHRQVADFFRFGTLRPAVPLAAAALLIAAGFIFDRPYAPAPQTGSRVSASEVEQAERTLDDIQLLRQFDAAVSNPRPAKPI